MRILKRGELKDEQLFIGCCSNCGCSVEIDATEGSFHAYDIRRVICPTSRCGYYIYAHKVDEVGRPVPWKRR